MLGNSRNEKQTNSLDHPSWSGAQVGTTLPPRQAHISRRQRFQSAQGWTQMDLFLRGKNKLITHEWQEEQDPEPFQYIFLPLVRTGC